MATPRRATRSRSAQATPQPLPAVDVRQSFSWGARGKANLRNQMAKEGISLAEGFSAARARATITTVPEEHEEEEDEEEDDDDDEDEDDGGVRGLHAQQQPMSRNGTYVEESAHYESSLRDSLRDQRYGSMPPPPPPCPAVPSFGTRQSTHAPHAPQAPLATRTPRWLSVAFFAIPRYLWRNLWALLVGALLFGIIAHISLPGRVGARRDDFFRGLKIAAGLPGYDYPPDELQKLWMQFRAHGFSLEELTHLPPIEDPHMQRLVNVYLRGLAADGLANHTALASRVSAMEEFLPPRMVVDVVHGKMVIGDAFWHAINDKIQGSNEIFDAFVAANEGAAIKIAEHVVTGHFEESLRTKRILSREELMGLLEDNSKELEKRMSSLVRSGTDDAINAARTIAVQVAREVAENTPSDLRAQLGALAKSNLIANTYDAMSSVNWFSPKMGAVVDPHHTSPTALKPSRDSSIGWFAKSVKLMTPGPTAALMPWQETGDCWCAAREEIKTHTSKAQLAVITEKKIMPDRLIVEHIPERGSENIRNAPRRYELWADLLSTEAAELMKHKLRQQAPQYDRACESSDSPPTETSICIAVGSYDIAAPNWVQSVPMLIDSDVMYDTGFEAGKFYYRVSTNHGADQTCTYRVRLTAH
jgi:hypothetical protein